ncbi:MAG TPA: hypothetical protein VHD62_13740 [Opitutaceae bacterium]|nr:hypothetical protein [Opitutaceae bacterium]
MFVLPIRRQPYRVNPKDKSSLPVDARSFWRKWGVAGFCGLVLGLGWSATKHLSWIGGGLAFGALCVLLGFLLDATRRKKNGDQA